MPCLLELLEPDIEATIRRLRDRKFTVDPISSRKFSRFVSVAGSAQKRHGNIIEKAIVEHLSSRPELAVWNDDRFQVPRDADLIANGALNHPEQIFGNELNYAPGERTLQIDALVYNKDTRTLRAYEIKRGFGSHDSGKRRQMLRDALCTQLLLKSYGRSKGLDPLDVSSHVIFYYGKLSLKPPIGLAGSDLDEHFGFSCFNEIEAVNQRFGERFRQTLYEILND